MPMYYPVKYVSMTYNVTVPTHTHTHTDTHTHIQISLVPLRTLRSTRSLLTQLDLSSPGTNPVTPSSTKMTPSLPPTLWLWLDQPSTSTWPLQTRVTSLRMSWTRFVQRTISLCRLVTLLVREWTSHGKKPSLLVSVVCVWSMKCGGGVLMYIHQLFLDSVLNWHCICWRALFV